MEVDEIQCNKFPRLNNNGTTNGRRLNSAKMGKTRNDDQNPDDEDDEENKCGTIKAVDLGVGTGINRFYNWPSSRIVRVSRATGGKDRHSKVLTSKGLRDRRVRLSVNTAIQFYDLQDRLGYDQPSKAVEWLLKAAATSIDELPPINTLFPDTPKQLSYEKRSSIGVESEQLGLDDTNYNGCGGADPPTFQNAQKSSACSSNSENSKGSGLSLSRSESRVRARERAKERVSEKEKENPISQATSFTELLNGGTSNNVNGTNSASSPNGGTTNDYFQKSLGHWSSSPMDYFTSGLSIRPAQMYLAVNPPVSSPLFSVTGDNHHHHQQHFSFVPDHTMGANNNNSNNNNNNSGSEYNLNFTISSSSGNNNSSGLAGFNRGTLQSNSSSSSSSFLPHHQRFPAIVDGSTSPSFFMENQNHHQFLPQASNGRYSAHRGGKGKN